MRIRPVSDLRNKFTEIEKSLSSNEPIFLTKNGYGAMVLMSIERFEMYEKGISETDIKLLEADYQAENTDKRLSHEEVFSRLRGKANEE